SRDGDVVEGEREGAAHLGARTELTRDDLDGAREAQDRTGLDRRADRLEEQLAGLGELTADDDELRVDDVAHGRERGPERAARVGHEAPAARVPGQRAGDDVAQGEGSVRLADALHERDRADHGLEAAAVAA